MPCRWSMFPGTTPWPIANGPDNDFPPRRSGNFLHSGDVGAPLHMGRGSAFRNIPPCESLAGGFSPRSQGTLRLPPLGSRGFGQTQRLRPPPHDWKCAGVVRGLVSRGHLQKPAASGETSINPKGPADSLDPDDPDAPKRMTRGGSFLCDASYCASYRPAARIKTSSPERTAERVNLPARSCVPARLRRLLPRFRRLRGRGFQGRLLLRGLGIGIR